MPVSQHSVHRMERADPESSLIPVLCCPQGEVPALQVFCMAIPVFPQLDIHIMTTLTHMSLVGIPMAVMWMEIELMTDSGLLVRSSHGLLP